MKYKVIINDFPVVFWTALLWTLKKTLRLFSAHYASLSTVIYALHDFFTPDYSQTFQQLTDYYLKKYREKWNICVYDNSQDIQ